MLKKLVTNFFNKEKYVFHYENWELYLRLGLKLKSIHRVLEFNQSQSLIYCTQHTQKIEAEQNSDKGRKSPVQINLQRLYGKKNGKLEK